jgi:hypothetical protein
MFVRLSVHLVSCLNGAQVTVFWFLDLIRLSSNLGRRNIFAHHMFIVSETAQETYQANVQPSELTRR